MRIHHFFSPEKVLESTVPPKGKSGRYILAQNRNPTNSPWKMVLRASHTKPQLVLRMIAKVYLGDRLSSDENLLLPFLAADSEHSTMIVKRLLSRSQNMGYFRNPAGSGLEVSSLIFLHRYYRSFSPEYSVSKLWSPIPPIPEERIIGVGYKDKGSLSIAPSWKDQMIYHDESEHEVNLDFLVLSFLGYSKGLSPG